MNDRRRDLEQALQVGISEKTAMGPLRDNSAMMQRLVAYLKGITGSDMELAEGLWTYLAHFEEFEIDGNLARKIFYKIFDFGF